MQLLRGLKNIPKTLKNTAITIGNFDGVHRGHQALLDTLVIEAKKKNLQTVLIIFEPQPNEFFLGDKAPARLMRLREKIETIDILSLRAVDEAIQENTGLCRSKAFRNDGSIAPSLRGRVDYLLCLSFNKKFSEISAEDFVSEFLIKKLKMKLCVVGDDFRFGARKAGDFNLLNTLSERHHFQLISMPTEQSENNRISSTQIRADLKAGNLKAAEKLLGHPYHMTGRVAHGNKLGRRLGFPTANLYLHRQVVPISGIFVVRVLGLDKIYYGAANVGVRPSIDHLSTRVLLEVYLLDFSQDIYGRYITVEFLHKLRDEERYENLELLREQIVRDVDAVKHWISCSAHTSLQEA